MYGGYTRLFNEGKLRVNDAFYLQNFKGIQNLGGAINKDLGNDVLGFSQYLGGSLKIIQDDCPLLNLFNLRPFLHANVVLAPNRHTPIQDLKSRVRASTGMGLSF